MNSFQHKLAGKSKRQRERILKNKGELLANIIQAKKNKEATEEKDKKLQGMNSMLTKSQAEKITIDDLLRLNDPEVSEISFTKEFWYAHKSNLNEKFLE